MELKNPELVTTIEDCPGTVVSGVSVVVGLSGVDAGGGFVGSMVLVVVVVTSLLSFPPLPPCWV